MAMVVSIDHFSPQWWAFLVAFSDSLAPRHCGLGPSSQAVWSNPRHSLHGCLLNFSGSCREPTLICLSFSLHVPRISLLCGTWAEERKAARMSRMLSFFSATLSIFFFYRFCYKNMLFHPFILVWVTGGAGSHPSQGREEGLGTLGMPDTHNNVLLASSGCRLTDLHVLRLWENSRVLMGKPCNMGEDWNSTNGIQASNRRRVGQQRYQLCHLHNYSMVRENASSTRLFWCPVSGLLFKVIALQVHWKVTSSDLGNCVSKTKLHHFSYSTFNFLAILSHFCLSPPTRYTQSINIPSKAQSRIQAQMKLDSSRAKYSLNVHVCAQLCRALTQGL